MNPTKRDWSQFLVKEQPSGASQDIVSQGKRDWSQYLQEPEKPKRTALEKAGRVVGQYALGAASAAALPYELAAPLATSKANRINVSLKDAGDTLEYLYEKNTEGFSGLAKPVEEWSKADQELYSAMTERIKNPSTAVEDESPDISIRGLAEKATGLDLHPEGVMEKAANWSGFLRNPTAISNLKSVGSTPKELLKVISPTGMQVSRGVGAGLALEMAEQGDFGPMGTIGMAILGDAIGGGVGKTGQTIGKLATQPKKTIAEAVAKFTPKEQKALQQEIIKDFREAGLQADAGTITGNSMVKMIQAKLAQSGLTGKAFDEFKNEITGQFKREYNALAEGLGEAKFATSHEAGQAIREGIKKIRDVDLQETRKFYEGARSSLTEKPLVNPQRLLDSIENIEKKLSPGKLKSPEQIKVLETLDTLKKDVTDAEGKIKFANVTDLMNNKIALNDIINYEMQGGSKQLLKELVVELDKTIVSHGKQNPKFLKNYINANKRFSEHAKTFRNKGVEQILKTHDASQIMNKMNSVQGIRDIEKVLSKTAEGTEILGNVKRLKLEDIIGKRLVNSTTQQVNLGTFSKLLERGKGREVIKEILGPQQFKKLEKLQKNAGKLAESANKFFNSSQTAVSAAEAAVMYAGMKGIVGILTGNIWPLLNVVGGVVGGKKLAGLFADKKFLDLLEDSILASEKGSMKEIIVSFENLRPYLMIANQEMK